MKLKLLAVLLPKMLPVEAAPKGAAPDGAPKPPNAGVLLPKAGLLWPNAEGAAAPNVGAARYSNAVAG